MAYTTISPHAWGWTDCAYPYGCALYDFPTRVGVDRVPDPGGAMNPGFPHTRGGGPSTITILRRAAAISPHAWGWTDWRQKKRALDTDFPTRVGVDRCASAVARVPTRFPHTRGGGPMLRGMFDRLPAISPHAWGWTARALRRADNRTISPHAWGWTVTMPGRAPHSNRKSPLPFRRIAVLSSLAHLSGWI